MQVLPRTRVQKLSYLNYQWRTSKTKFITEPAVQKEDEHVGQQCEESTNDPRLKLVSHNLQEWQASTFVCLLLVCHQSGCSLHQIMLTYLISCPGHVVVVMEPWGWVYICTCSQDIAFWTSDVVICALHCFMIIDLMLLNYGDIIKYHDKNAQWIS